MLRDQDPAKGVLGESWAMVSLPVTGFRSSTGGSICSRTKRQCEPCSTSMSVETERKMSSPFWPVRLVKAAGSRIELAAQNTGAIARRTGPQKRRDTFVPMSRFPDRRPAEVDGLDDRSVVVWAECHDACCSRTLLYPSRSRKCPIALLLSIGHLYSTDCMRQSSFAACGAWIIHRPLAAVCSTKTLSTASISRSFD